MRVPTNIFRRGAIFYHRQVVPKDLLAITHRRELKLSLQTRCPHTARQRGAAAQLRAEILFAYLRWKKKAMLPEQSHIAIQAFYFQTLERDAAYKRSGMRPDNSMDAQLDALRAVELDIIEALRSGGVGVAREYMSEELTTLPEADPTSPNYGELCQSVLRVTLESIRRVRERELGNWGGVPSDPLLLTAAIPPLIGTPTPPVPGTPVATPASAGTSMKAANANEPMMEELIESFFREKRKASASGGGPSFDKYEREFRASLEWLRQYFDGYKEPSAYQKRDFVKYKDTLLEVPKNFQKFFPGRTIKEAISENKAAHRPTLDANTIKNKRLGDLKTFFRWLHSNDYIATNPTDGVSVTRNKKAATQQKRYPFSIDDLNRIFQSPAFLELSACRGLGTGSSHNETHKYWLPLLALYTGCRMAELAQLQCADAVTLEGSLFLRITEEVKAETKDRNWQKSVKNAGSDRLVPVHPDLIKLGFDKFVATAKASKDDRLFPGCERSKADGSFTPYSKYFARFLKKVGVKKDQMLAFHSFRHNFEDGMREAGLDQHIRYRLAGRADNHSSAGYGNGHRPARLLEEISKIQYSGLDLSHLVVTESKTTY